MATTAAGARPVVFLHPDEQPEVVEARAALAASSERHGALDARLRRHEAILDPYCEIAASEDDMLEARENIAATRVEHARATRDLRLAEAAWHHERALARDRVRIDCHQRKRALVAAMLTALEDAAHASRALAEIENHERSACGDWHIGGLAWPELAMQSTSQGSRLDDWRRAARDCRLLD